MKKPEITFDPGVLVARVEGFAVGRQPARERTVKLPPPVQPITAQLDHTPHRPTIAERAARVDWQEVDAILARVPAAPPLAGDER